MKHNVLRILLSLAALASAVYAQGYQRQATMVGGGGPDRGKCTIEVVVDDVAQVEIRGSTATIRNISGQPAQWRRFECTSPLPANPANFNFAGVDGRGRQQLIRDPRNGGVAVVQIEDKDGGSEGYTFDITWSSGGFNGGGNVQRGPNPGPIPGNRDNPGGNVDRNPNPNPGPIPGNRDNPGYRENERPRQDDRADGQYRPNYRDSEYYRRYGYGFPLQEAVRICQQEVLRQAAERFRTNDMHFNRTSVDDRPGRDDWVMGTLDVFRGRGEERFGFACSMNFDNGRLRSAQIDPRPEGQR